MKEDWDIDVSTDTLKRILKADRMRWRRMRRMKAKRPPLAESRCKRAALKVLKKLDTTECIDLYYMDATGLTLVPPTPYGWQAEGAPSNDRVARASGLMSGGL